MPTFGYETARHTGTHLVLNLMEDSRTTNRWYFVVVMGRSAGHLALGIGKAAGATLTVIPEEFPEGWVSLDTVCTVLEGAMLKRRTMGRKYGLAVIAEGVASRLDPQDLARVLESEANYDSQGLMRLGEVPLATALRRQVQRWFLARGEQVSIVDTTLGYDLRSAQPIPFDIDYTRTLGYGAVRFLLSDSPEGQLHQHGLVCLENGRLAVVPFEDLRDQETGDIRLRRIDIQSEYYNVARQYMIRLEPNDFSDPEMLTALAESVNMPAEEFNTRFNPMTVATPGAGSTISPTGMPGNLKGSTCTTGDAIHTMPRWHRTTRRENVLDPRNSPPVLAARRLPIGDLIGAIVRVPRGPVPDLHQHAQAGPWVEPGHHPGALFPGWNCADLLDSRRQRLLGEAMDIGGVGAGVVIDGAQGCPLGHQAGGAAVVGGGNADLDHRTSDGELHQVHRVTGGPRCALRFPVQTALHGLVLFQPHHLTPEAPDVLGAAGRQAHMGHSRDQTFADEAGVDIVAVIRGYLELQALAGSGVQEGSTLAIPVAL